MFKNFFAVSLRQTKLSQDPQNCNLKDNTVYRVKRPNKFSKISSQPPSSPAPKEPQITQPRVVKHLEYKNWSMFDLSETQHKGCNPKDNTGYRLNRRPQKFIASTSVLNN